MFLIVFHHVGYHGYFARPTEWWAVLIWGAVMWHVDGFVAISGWFGIKVSWKKFISLYGTMAFYTAIGCLLWWLTDRGTFGLRSFYVSGGWFGGSYLMLMLISPILNASVVQLKANGKLVSSWCLFAIGMTLAWIPGHLNTAVSPSGGGAWSFLCMTFVYFTARVAKTVFTSPLPKRKLAVGLLVLPIGLIICGGARVAICLMKGKAFTWDMLNWLSVYDAPHIWLFAIILLMLFAWHIDMPRMLKNICSYVGPSMFGVYLIHEVMHNGREIYRIPQAWLSSLGCSPFACVVITAMSTFTFCIVVDLVRRSLVYMLRGITDPWIGRLESAGSPIPLN